MKIVLLSLFITSFSLSYASDGEYRCDSVQNVSFRDLSSRVLSISYHIEKVKELQSNGLRSSALNVVQDGMNKLERTRELYKNTRFCYSLSKRVKYQKNLLVKHQIELSLLESGLKKFNDCSYALMKLEKETELVNEDSNSLYEKFIATSKTITKAELIRRDKSCDTIHQDKISALLIKQNNLLSRLYQDRQDS